MSNERYFVYMHILPNGKKYVGITKRKPQERWRGGKGYPKNAEFTEAINEHGWENIQHLILYENLTRKEAEEKEVELIARYRSNNPHYGYNHAKGGGLNNGWRHSADSIEMNKLHQPNAKRVGQYSMTGKLVNIFSSIKEAERVCDITHPMVTNCCKGKQKSAGGYVWKYI